VPILTQNNTTLTNAIVLTFAIPATNTTTNSLHDAPPIIWKVDFPTDSSIAIDTFTVLNGSLSHQLQQQEESASNKKRRRRPTHVYIHGWQSWSFAGSVPRGEPQPTSAMPNYLSKSFNFGGNTPPLKHYFYKSDMFLAVTSNDRFHSYKEDEMLDENNSSCIIFGFISQKEQFGLVTMNDALSEVAMHCSLDGMIVPSSTPTATTVSTDWAWCQIIQQEQDNVSSLAGRMKEPMAEYLDFVANYNGSRHKLREPNCIGWCSWYHYYENIAEQVLIDNFETLANLQGVDFNMAMCDDGYMLAWGDWDTVKLDKFPSGKDKAMAAIAAAMKSRGMRPGVWLAPFAADKKSQLVKDHPDWIIRNNSGRYANSANCGKFFYGLDATNPLVLDHARRCIRRAVHEWGFEVLKLDFLYACCLDGNGKHDLSMTRAQTMTLALQTLREAAGDNVFIIGCGCPIGPAIGMVDGMRVSADTGPTWNPSFPLPWWDNSTLPCLRAMIRNSLTRACLSHRFFLNDPDCLLLGTSTDLTEAEVISAATIISMTGGMLLLSDDILKLSPERFEIVSKISPISRAVGRPLDLHCSYDNSIPSLLQLWCSEETHDTVAYETESLCSIRTGELRNCVSVCSGLGRWTIVSLSNWLEVDAVVSAPFSSLLYDASAETGLPPSSSSHHENTGYHVFAFWSSKYVWVPASKRSTHNRQSSTSSQKLSKRLGPHESEIFHIKPVNSSKAQYIGSDLHYTCGHEVESFEQMLEQGDGSSNYVAITIKQGSAARSGKIFMYIPVANSTTKFSARIEEAPLEVKVVARIPSSSSSSPPPAAGQLAGCVIRVRCEFEKASNLRPPALPRIKVTWS